MRRFLLSVLLVVAAAPGWAAKKVTVAQLEQVLATDMAAHKADRVVLRQLGAIELSEELTEESFERLSAKLPPHSESMQKLRLLADQSAFLEPPMKEAPQTPAPDDATQQQMIASARSYVAQTLTHLPNLLATQTTLRFDDSPKALDEGAWPVRAGLHLVDSSNRAISIREEQDPASSSENAVWQEKTGLVSGGEFGSTLAMVLADVTNGKATWSHWQQMAGTRVAVFHYEVPRAASHYEIIGAAPRQAALQGTASSDGGMRRTAGIQVTPTATDAAGVALHRSRPGYHGSLYIDPASGTILRLTLEADAKDDPAFRRASILVDYGAIQIGAHQFVCPVRSLALTQLVPDAQNTTGDAPSALLNESIFSNYHRFGADVRVVATPGGP